MVETPHFIWTDGIETALNDIRNKALKNSESHKSNYYHFKGYLKYFRVPTIILSGMNSVFSVGLQPYVPQGIISVLCCSISLMCGIIASIELFLAIQDMMEKEIVSSKEFYILSCDIFKTLSIEREHRMLDGVTYLENINTKYCHLIEQGNLVDKDHVHLQLMHTVADATSNIHKHLLENKKIEQIEQTELQIEKMKENKEEEDDNVKIKICENIGIEYDNLGEENL